MLEEEWSLPIFPFTSSTGLLFLPVATVSLVLVSGVVCIDPFCESIGFTVAGCAALCGCNIPAVIEAMKFHPILLYSGKFLLTYALGYHYFAGLRHIVGAPQIANSQYFDYYPDKLTWKFINDSSLWIIWGVFGLACLLTVAKLPALKDKKEKKQEQE